MWGHQKCAQKWGNLVVYTNAFAWACCRISITRPHQTRQKQIRPRSYLFELPSRLLPFLSAFPRPFLPFQWSRPKPRSLDVRSSSTRDDLSASREDFLLLLSWGPRRSLIEGFRLGLGSRDAERRRCRDAERERRRGAEGDLDLRSLRRFGDSDLSFDFRRFDVILTVMFLPFEMTSRLLKSSSEASSLCDEYEWRRRRSWRIRDRDRDRERLWDNFREDFSLFFVGRWCNISLIWKSYFW